MIGVTEILLIVGVIGAVSLFGRKTIKKLMGDVLGVKKDYEEIKKEIHS